MASLHSYREAGYDVAALEVDTENPTGALGLYGRLGFRTVAGQTMRRFSADLG